MPQHIAQRGKTSIVHVGRGDRHIAQAGRAELTPIAVLELHMARGLRGNARSVIVVSTQKIERARADVADAVITAGIDHAGPDEKWHAVVVELAVAEVGSAVTDEAIAAADEQSQAAFG